MNWPPDPRHPASRASVAAHLRPRSGRGGRGRAHAPRCMAGGRRRIGPAGRPPGGDRAAGPGWPSRHRCRRPPGRARAGRSVAARARARLATSARRSSRGCRPAIAGSTPRMSGSVRPRSPDTSPRPTGGSRSSPSHAEAPLDALTAAAARRSPPPARSPRVRAKGTAQKAYDLRPLLDEVGVDGERRRRPSVRIRTRFHPELGSGRPEEVVAAPRTRGRRRAASRSRRCTRSRSSLLADGARRRPGVADPTRAAEKRARTAPIDAPGRSTVHSAFAPGPARRLSMSAVAVGPRPPHQSEGFHVRSHRDRREAVPRRGRHRARGRAPRRRARRQHQARSRPARRRR